MARQVNNSASTPRSRGMQGRVGYRMVKLGELLMGVADEALAPLDIRPRHFNVLATLAADDSLSQQELSRLLGIDPNVMVGVIDDLERGGLAQRRRNPADRRRHVIVVTADGKKVLREGAKLLDVAENRFFELLTPEERALLGDMTGRLLTKHRPVPMVERAGAGDGKRATRSASG